MTTQADIEAIQFNVLRQSYPVAADVLAKEVNAGRITIAQVISGCVGQADKRTKPALILSNHIEGAVPNSDTLTNRALFCQNQYDSYSQAGSSNPTLGCYEALGVAFSSTTAFNILVTGKTLQVIITSTYVAAFGVTPTAQQSQHFVDQYAYFYNLYTNAGIPASTAADRAKGAVIGQILGHGGMTASTNNSIKADAWLTNAGNGSPAYNTPL